MFGRIQEWSLCATSAKATAEPLVGLDLNERALWLVGLFYMGLVLVGIITQAILFFRFQARPLQWERRVAAFENTPWQPREAWRVLLFLMALYFIVSFVKRTIAFPEDDQSVWIILQSAFFHLAGIAMVALAVKRQHLTWQRAFGISADRIVADIRRGFVLYLAMMPLVVFYSVIYQGLLRYAGYRVSPQDVIVLFVSEESPWGRAYTFLLAAVIAPLFEELIFRGVALPVLGRYRGTTWAMIVLSATFAMIHFHLPSLVPLFLVAMTLSIGYVYSGSLPVPIVTHALFNLVNLTVLTLLRSGV